MVITSTAPLVYPYFWPLAFLPFVLFVMLVIWFSSSNAVNLTDGLDGLGDWLHDYCGRCALTVLTYVSGHVDLRGLS